jgi:hypothetical protein
VRIKILLPLAGLLAGLGLGLFLGWIVWPVEFYDTDVSFLHPTYKFEYAVMVGAAYELDGNWERAAERLAELREPDLTTWLRDLIHQAIADGQDPVKIRHLVSIAGPLGAKTEIMAPFAREVD